MRPSAHRKRCSVCRALGHKRNNCPALHKQGCEERPIEAAAPQPTQQTPSEPAPSQPPPSTTVQQLNQPCYGIRKMRSKMQIRRPPCPCWEIRLLNVFGGKYFVL